MSTFPFKCSCTLGHEIIFPRVKSQLKRRTFICFRSNSSSHMLRCVKDPENDSKGLKLPPSVSCSWPMITVPFPRKSHTIYTTHIIVKTWNRKIPIHLKINKVIEYKCQYHLTPSDTKKYDSTTKNVGRVLSPTSAYTSEIRIWPLAVLK